MVELVPGGGFEPPRVAPHAPQTCASARFRHPGTTAGPARQRQGPLCLLIIRTAPEECQLTGQARPQADPALGMRCRPTGASRQERAAPARAQESYGGRGRSRGDGVRPGVRPRLASGLPLTSRRSIVISIGGAALM